MIMLVDLEVLGEVLDSRGQQSDLYFRRTGILVVQLEFVDNFVLVSRESFTHRLSSLLAQTGDDFPRSVKFDRDYASKTIVSTRIFTVFSKIQCFRDSRVKGFT